MPIEYAEDSVVFHDIIEVAEAEGLLEWLQGRPGAQVDLCSCTHLHPANLQVLMAASNAVAVWPEDADLRGWLKTVLKDAPGRKEEGDASGQDHSDR
ncbi:MAG: hypothetical protein WCJ30_03865 [Deltaproteobacteria bacterium]